MPKAIPCKNGMIAKYRTILTFLSCFFNNFFSDVNSWLVTFGFHLHNAIPGFPVPKFDLTEPSYELVKSQQWEDIPVRNKTKHTKETRQNVPFYSDLIRHG